MRIVIIGNGMVGSRFAQDVAAHVRDAHVTVLGKESHAPYNRVLLSSVVAGKTDARFIALDADTPGARVLRGVAAVDIDREQQVVTASDGSLHAYDRLVFATGSAARIPQIQHVAGPDGLVPGVFVLKELADAEGIVAALPRSRSAVVLGAGVLGLEVATGLAARGLAVTLVHHADRLMERQLGSVASQIASDSLARLGISVVTTTTVTRVLAKRGRVSGVELDNGARIDTDLLVMCAGTIPETALARRAGLPCDRGILVGEDLASTGDANVFAVGDCAQPPEGATGLVAQGWEQARRLVAAWSGRRVAADPTSDAAHDLTNVVRVKAPGLEVVTMGLSGKFDHGGRELRAVRISDPAVGRFVEVVIGNGVLVGATVVGDQATASALQALYTRRLPVPADPAHLIVRPMPGAAPAKRPVAEMDAADTVCQCNGVLVGATVVGDQATASALQALYTRRLPVPADPAHLIVRPMPGAAPAKRPVAEMDAADTVCQCNGVTKGRICDAIADGCGSVEEVSKATRASTGCGDCKSLVRELIAASAETNRKPAMAGAGEAS